MNIYSHFSASGTKLKPFPFISELAMEGYLVENSGILNLFDDHEVRIKENEKSWKRGEGHGRIDLLAFYGESVVAVIELKNGVLDEAALKQLYEYFENKKHLDYVADSFELSSNEEAGKFQWLGVLVGTDIQDGLKTTIEHNNSSGKTPVAVIILNRYKCEEERRVYTITDTVIVPNKSTKDYTKYVFNEGVYNKRALIFGMIQAYVGKHFSTINSQEFKNKINALKKKGKPILKDYDEAVREDTTPNSKGNIDPYYFTTKPEDAIAFNDGAKVAVLNWWRISDMPLMKEIAKTLGYSFEEVS